MMPDSALPAELCMLEAQPEPLEIDLRRTAVIVVDMQNGFVSKGSMSDMWGRDIPARQKLIAPISQIADAARAKRCKVIYTVHQYSADLRETGGPGSVTWHKSMSVRGYREHPEWRDKYLLRGTWGAAIVTELQPQEGDIVVEKARYSAFFETNLDTILKTYNAKYLIFVGVATNNCVESTIRDANYRGYFPILVSDATGASGPSFMQEATIYNTMSYLGWVTTTDNIIKALPSP